ncbi:pentapeptide repeat-containing protein [Sorangium sp. So ce1389]|uniref:pentapeptide repeat-containing protein n=1 Tax=Sorangium sp. So ce1389 TaxID=3133336 RepID=UPI003F5DAEE6
MQSVSANLTDVNLSSSSLSDAKLSDAGLSRGSLRVRGPEERCGLPGLNRGV